MNETKDSKRDTIGHGGNIHKLERQNRDTSIIDFSANINPLGPPSWLRSCISSSISSLLHYPDPDCFDFISAIAEHYSIDPNIIVPANGSTEILYTLPKGLSFKRAVIPVPSYIDYAQVMKLNNIEVIHCPLTPSQNFGLDCHVLEKLIEEDDIVIIGSPNNPTGTAVDNNTIAHLANTYPSTWFVIDEAFIDFLGVNTSVAGQFDNVITLNSLTKFYALPGLRLGFGSFPRHIVDNIKKHIPPWSVNTLSQRIGAQLFSDSAYRAKSLEYIKKMREQLQAELDEFADLHVFPAEANYLLVKINGNLTAPVLAERLLQQGIAIRVCSNYTSLDDSYFRVAVRTEEENLELINALRTHFSASSVKRLTRPKRTPALMMQGTSSNAGKSVLAAAFCRILIQDGIRVAPFKAQNMSLNSFVTHDGLEMGRAQVVQAQAAKLDPDVHMNPVLLKPNSDIGSQVIVHGKPVGNMNVAQYVNYKEDVWQSVCRSYDYLAQQYDAIILEGAGSPGEVNLKHHDIVNMRMANYAGAEVLLVGDIDRGGVYASFIGTMEVMEEWERKRISGFLVNRFRGDATLLQPAHDYVANFTGKPVLGTVPYISQLGIPEEDSVSFKNGKLQKKRPAGEHVEIAVINLPHISNFTDIEPFLDEPDVYIHIVDTPEQLHNPQAIIIPGSKNVIGDLQFIQASGLGDKITDLAHKDIEIVGICGGYQLLGGTISDPHSIESDNEIVQGTGLLDIDTTLAKDKTLTRRIGTHIPSGTEVFGYEIHHGLSTSSASPLLEFADHSHCGTIHPEKMIWGAYLHGIFDSDSFRRWFIDNLRERKGYLRLNKVMASYDLESAFDALADIVRQSVDMDEIYNLLGM